MKRRPEVGAGREDHPKKSEVPDMSAFDGERDPPIGDASSNNAVSKEGPVDASTPDEDFEELKERFKIFSITFLSIVLDLTFLTLWFASIKGVHYIFNVLGQLPGLDELLRNSLEIFFDTATLCVVVVYTLHDLRRSVARIWKKK